MNPSYRRDKDHNYMILEEACPVTGNEFQVRMLILNQIPGILPCKMRKIDGEAGFYYEITSLQPMARIYEKKRMGREDIRQLLAGIGKAMNGAREFLLDTNQLLLDPDYIYMDVETKEVFLCCLPLYEGDASAAFRGLAEYILKKLDHGDQAAVLWGYEIYSKTIEENYSIQNVLESVCPKTGEKPRQERTEREEFPEEPESRKEEKMYDREPEGALPEEEKPEQPDVSADQEKETSEILPLIQKGLILACGLAGIGGISWFAACFGGLTQIQTGGIFFLGAGILIYFSTIWKGFPRKEKVPRMPPGYEAGRILQEEEDLPEEWETQEPPERPEEVFSEAEEKEEFGATTLLQTSYAGDYAVLVSMEPGQRENIVLDRDVLIVGKLAGQSDIVLNQPVISRVHAKLERRTEGYYLTDQNSTNGTYLNGVRLEAFESRKLHTADEVYFASLGYYFKE